MGGGTSSNSSKPALSFPSPALRIFSFASCLFLFLTSCPSKFLYQLSLSNIFNSFTSCLYLIFSIPLPAVRLFFHQPCLLFSLLFHQLFISIPFPAVRRYSLTSCPSLFPYQLSAFNSINSFTSCPCLHLLGAWSFTSVESCVLCFAWHKCPYRVRMPVCLSMKLCKRSLGRESTSWLALR